MHSITPETFMTMPSINHRASTAWSAHEDQTLLRARAQGLNWTPIQHAHFPTKTPNACRKRHERLIERRKAEDWDADKLEKLAREYLDIRREMWTPLASRLGEKWQVVESKCMEKGLKNIQAISRSATRREKSTITNLDDSGLGGFEPSPEVEDVMTVREFGPPSSGSSSPGRSKSLPPV